MTVVGVVTVVRVVTVVKVVTVVGVVAVVRVVTVVSPDITDIRVITKYIKTSYLIHHRV